jgi:hypothetical protein
VQWRKAEPPVVSRAEVARLIEMLMRIDERTAFIVRWIEEEDDEPGREDRE